MSLFDTGVRPHIDAYLKKKSEEERDYGDYWSASSAGYCMRLVMMRRLGVPKVPELQEADDRQTRVFEAGHIFHEWVQRITRDAGISIASELELQDEDLMIRGHFDDLVLISYDESGEQARAGDEIRAQHLILYDYKTANSQAFNYKKEEIGDYHRMQLGTYMYMLRKNVQSLDKPMQHPRTGEKTAQRLAIHTADLTEARILQISKDDLRMREFQLMWTPELEKDVVGYWKTLNGYWRDKKLPRCTCLERDGGFMGKRSKKGKVYNDFYYEDEPCSLKWFELNKSKLKEK